jgi:hypothetical protein
MLRRLLRMLCRLLLNKTDQRSIQHAIGMQCPKWKGEGEGNEGTVKSWLGELYGSTQP